MLKRGYGKEGEQLSIIGFGGVILMNQTQEDCNNYVSEALDMGVNYFDVAPGYKDAQEKLGPALRGKRNGIFLACKTEMRTAEDAQIALEDSLKKLETDYFDLYQMHAVSSMEDVNTIMGPGGCMEVFLKAKEKGIIRHIGFSAHSEEAAVAIMEQFDFESVLFPYNWVNVNVSGFGEKILEKAIEKGVTRLALKGMALTNWVEDEDKKYANCWYKPIDDRELADLALRFTLSKPITAALSPGDIRLFRMAFDIVKDFKPITSEEIEILKSRSKGMKPIF